MGIVNFLSDYYELYCVNWKNIDYKLLLLNFEKYTNELKLLQKIILKYKKDE